MGKVYEFSEIANNRVPKTEDFLKAKELVLKELSNFVKSGEIYGAKVYGSVAKGTPNERSDFDLVIIAETDSCSDALRQVIDGIFDETHVDIDPISIKKSFALRGFHSIDEPFLRHIKSINNNGNIVGNDPLDVLKPFDLPITKVHEEYFAQKVRRLKEGLFTNSEIDRHRVLQRALEAPVNIGRRLLDALPCLGYPFDLKDDSKQAVIKSFQEIFGNTKLLDGFKSLTEQDKQYTLFLKDTLKGLVSRSEYESKISALSKDCISQSVSWVSDLSEVYLGLLEGNQRLPEGNISMHPGKERF
jgi:hypothetical protein